MAGSSREPASGGPAAVAVHDDRHVEGRAEASSGCGRRGQRGVRSRLAVQTPGILRLSSRRISLKSTFHNKVSPEKKGSMLARKGFDATWSAAEGAAGGADDRLHVVEIPLERPAASSRQPILRLRASPLEGLGARHVLGLLELAPVDAQVPVGRLHQRLEVVEGEGIRGRQGAEEPEAQPMMDEEVDLP